MARSAPVQARSIASMNRMLDAGEQLFYEGGSAAVTLEAIVERSETSVGSFYARFDMHVDVFEISREGEMAGFDFVENFIEATLDNFVFGGADNFLFREHRRMRFRAGDILRV